MFDVEVVNIQEKARKFCSLTGLEFMAVTWDGWLDTMEQRDLSPKVWFAALRVIENREERIEEIKYGSDFEGQLP